MSSTSSIHTFLFLCTMQDADLESRGESVDSLSVIRREYIEAVLSTHKLRMVSVMQLCDTHSDFSLMQHPSELKRLTSECEQCVARDEEECERCSCRDEWPCADLRMAASLYRDREGFDVEWAKVSES